jgi:dGTPase
MRRCSGQPRPVGLIEEPSMEWPQLLSSWRLSSMPRAATPSKEGCTDFERDWDRIVFSTAFRRLHDKTQVFPLLENDVVHSRLTHSLEVASVGRSLRTRIGREVCERENLPNLSPTDFGRIGGAAQTASWFCLRQCGLKPTGWGLRKASDIKARAVTG